jgi:predicted Ser/Thr protein kinase
MSMNMNITDPVVLRNDVLLVPVTDLSAEVREKFTFDEGDFAISRVHGRAPSQVIDHETASLLQLFRKPRTIVGAVIENSIALKKDPQAWLDELLPHLGSFLVSRVLVPAGAEDEKEFAPTLANGSRAGTWQIAHCVSLIEDSEVYRVQDGERDAALKIARDPAPFERSLFANEAAILARMNGVVAPRLHDSGTHDGRPYLALEWCNGTDAATAAAHRRHDRAALLRLACSIADAYVQLHEAGVIHADVHPRNIVVGDDDSVRIIDFGLGTVADEEPRVGRGGQYYFYEPEFLVAQSRGELLHATFAGEQYSIAALLYMLIAGNHYLDFRLERDEMVRQVIADAPLPFTLREVAPWPEVESILGRALAKEPAKRFATTRELAAALAKARQTAIAEALATPVSAEAIAFSEQTLARFARGGVMYESGYPEAPTTSINFGAAGAAVGLLRVAEMRGDPMLLALADIWRSRAARDSGTANAYYNTAIDLDPEVLGRITPYHTESGIHAAAALIANARGDLHACSQAIERFIAASSHPCAELDLTLGRSSTLIGAAILIEAAGRSRALVDLGDATLEAIWRELDERPAIPDSAAETYLGIAHGWSGYMFAALRWCAASGHSLPPALLKRLEQFASLAIERGRKAYWRRQTGSHAADVLPGWCNGSAGHVFLWTAAWDAFRDERFLELAERVARHTAEEPAYTADLCCGAAGRAYALLNLYRHTGAAEWLSAARRLANAAAAYKGAQVRAHSLWKGELGIAVLIADLESPENARMPFFE